MAVYTVSQVTSHIRRSLDTDPWLEDLWVQGEVSNFQVASSGHTYFSLKDRQAVLRAVMFRGQPGADLLSEGASVSAHGKVSFYEPRGSTDFIVDIAMPLGVGELALELERLKRKLEAEGLFELSRKRRLPQFPKVVGVVTSPSGAVLHDILNILEGRYPLVEVVLAATRVQGETAAAEIATAIERLDREAGCDVIIVARGGGSLEDLWAFNVEMVARAIYASKTPIISAIGHETDETIADYVADARAPTPTAAAGMAVPDGPALLRSLAALQTGMSHNLSRRMGQQRDEVSRVQRRMESALPDIGTWRRRIDDVGRVAQSAANGILAQARLGVDGAHHRLRGLDPQATLGRGFSIVELTASGEVVSSPGQVVPGDPLKITVAHGVVPATASGNANGRRPGRKSKGVPTSGMDRLL